jgi:quinoprotein dehydrogenase-associated probable ABC transporter substrate-binding protein
VKGLAVLTLCTVVAIVATRHVRDAEASRDGRALRVCADPNNLPFSNDREEGFENALARLVANDFRMPLEYTWWPQRRGFVRNTLNAGACDVVMGTPTRFDPVLTTRPYYRSSYVFVSLRSRRLGLRSLDDRRLRKLRVGVQMIGDDFANSPPAHALSARGMVSNIVGYSVLGDYSQPNPPARIVDAVVNREIDAAVVWGPLAGFFAARAPAPLDVTPVSPEMDSPQLPFVFDISMATRKNDDALRRRLDDFLERRRPEVDAILAAFHVPRTDGRRRSGS